ncbi:unnamed protein product [Penicillium salamii]|nr:unnamed protein product [Penicillium salamii]
MTTMPDEKKLSDNPANANEQVAFGQSHETSLANVGGLHRRLNNRQIQLIAAGGSIGTALFINIGGGLAKGGPANLFITFALYSGVLALVNNSIAEMSTHMPVAGGFVRLAGAWVDDAFGVMAGWNFFFYEALTIPFEITALTFVLGFWSDRVSKSGVTAAICAVCIVLYGLLNVAAVKFYGESEFWLSGGKILLIFILFFFVFISMVGGNPQNDAYGFRYWSSPGAFAKYRSEGDLLGHFEGFLAALWTAAFTIVGPEYISMVAAEARRPSIYVKSAFITVYYRFCLFFVLGALCVGIAVPYNEPRLVEIFIDGTSSGGSAASSPYVIAMANLGIEGLPHLVNALLLTTIFSAGNTYTYCASRTLYGLALEGRAPAFLRYTNSQGVPLYAFAVVMCFPFLSFLQVSNGSSEVLNWLVTYRITTGGALINFVVISVTFLFYYRACKAQGVDRRTRFYYGRFQPYGAWAALIIQVAILFCYGYSGFAPATVSGFFANYTMQLLAFVTFFGWKLIRKTKFVKAKDCDLVWERPAIDQYEAQDMSPITGFWEEIGHLIGIKKSKTGEELRQV